MSPNFLTQTRKAMPSQSVLLFLAFLLLSTLSLSFFNSLKKAPGTNLASTVTDRQTRMQALDKFGKLPVSFESNQGQFDKSVQFAARGQGYNLFLTREEAVLTLRQNKTEKNEATVAKVLRMKTAGSQTASCIEGLNTLPGRSNYFSGNRPAEWKTDITNYERVKYSAVYPGIDLVYYSKQRQLEYDFIVAPQADPKAIQLQFEGADKVSVNENGELVLKVAESEMLQHKPTIYQEINGTRQEVAGHYSVNNDGTVSFEIGQYDSSRELVIDPVLQYSTFLGGNDDEDARAVAIDLAGNLFITGQTISTNFPVTPGAVQSTIRGTADAYVVKVSPDGSAILFATYLGGNESQFGFTDEGNAIAVDGQGNVYVVGTTDAPDFPTTPSALLSSNPGPSGFLTKISPDGKSLLYSSYIGGGGTPKVERATGVIICAPSTAFVTGYTSSSSFPTTPTSFSPNKISPPTASDAFLIGIDTAASGSDSLAYGTYLGGMGTAQTAPFSIDQIQAVATDLEGHLYVVGHTAASDFPTTANAYDKTFNGGSFDSFVAKILPKGMGAADLVYSSFLGGSGDDLAVGVAVTPTGNVYVTGLTNSTNYPTQNAFQPTNSGGNFGAGFDAFMTCLDTTKAGAAGLSYSTFVGGIGDDLAWGIAADCNGKVFITGVTIPLEGNVDTNNFPTTPGAVRTTYQGEDDAFFVEIDTKKVGAPSLVYSTILGGRDDDFGFDVELDQAGNIYIVGFTGSNNFPITPGALQTTKRGLDDAFITKFSEPGLNICTSAGIVSDGRTGSVLIYPLYTSDPLRPQAENTRINITNTSDTLPVTLHLFFVDGVTCSVKDTFACLTAKQTLSFQASDLDPGVMGYILAVAVDPKTGCPIRFNHLIGDEYVKLSSGHQANLAAEGIAAGSGCVDCKVGTGTATLAFDGFAYSALPRVLALDNIPSPANNSTLLVVNRIGGSMLDGADRIGPIFGLIYNDVEQSFSFSDNGGCQIKKQLSNSFPITAPRLSTIIPNGRTGWMKFWSTQDRGLTGAMINLGAGNSFSQGHNLHKLTYTTTSLLTIPVFPPSCNF